MEAAIGLSYYSKNRATIQLFYTVTYLYKHQYLTRLKQMLLHRSDYIFRHCKWVDTSLQNREQLEEKMPPSYNCMQSQ